jgi:hypothetical protein
MMIPQKLTLEMLSRDPATAPTPLGTLARSRGLRASSAALCLIGLLGAAACSGSVDEPEKSSPEVSDSTNDRSSAGTRDTTSARDTSNAAEGTDTSDRAEDEQSSSDISRVGSGSRSSSGGGRRRPNVITPDDAGVLDDAGAIDAGAEDGGVVEVDAGVVEVDAGDAGAAP